MLRPRRAAQLPPDALSPNRPVRGLTGRARLLGLVVAGGVVLALTGSWAAAAAGAQSRASPEGSRDRARSAVPGLMPAPLVTPGGSPIGPTSASAGDRVAAPAGAPVVTVPRAAEPSASPAPSPLAPVVLTPGLSSALTKRLAELRAQFNIPGVEAVILFANGRSWRAHAGFQDYSGRVAVQNSTAFPIASVTKTFIAALVIQLAQEGRFQLDDAAIRYLPGAAVDARVTIRQLLNHTSGLSDFFSNSAIDTAILDCPTCVWTPAKSLSYVKKPLFAPGAGWAYSNTNYVLLGQLAEVVTGQSYAESLRQRFFAPLGLISTFVQGKEAAPYAIAHSYRFFTSSRSEKPTPLWDGTSVSPFRSVTTAAGAAGDVASSARDLAVWARALYGGRVLGAAGTAAMVDVAASQSLGSSVPYGLGAQQFVVAGRSAYGHGGRLMGARSVVRHLPAEGVSIAVVINTDRGDPAVIAEALALVVLPPMVPPPLPTPSPSSSPGATPQASASSEPTAIPSVSVP